MEEERLFGGRLRLTQRQGVFPLSMDSMALGDFATVRPGDSVWDLGCGSGALGLLLYGRESSVTYTGVDCQRDACALARENLTVNGLPGEILCEDIRKLAVHGPAGCARLVISNPPYFPKGKPGRLDRGGCGLEELCQAAGRLLVNGGRFALIYPAGELAEVFSALRRAGMEPKRLRLVSHTHQASPRLALIEGVRQGRPGLTILPNLVWYQPDGAPTDEYRRIYHETEPSPYGN